MTSATEYDASNDQRAALLGNLLDTLSPTVLADPNLPDILARLIDEQLPTNGQGPGVATADAGLSDLMGLNERRRRRSAPTRFSQASTTTTTRSRANGSSGRPTCTTCPARPPRGVRGDAETAGALSGGAHPAIPMGREPSGSTGSTSNGRAPLFGPERAAAVQASPRLRRPAPDRTPGPTRSSTRCSPLHRWRRPNSGGTSAWSDVIRDRATDPSSRSVAVVRRAILDLRNNLKNSSYG